jgi:hypothetical protein
VGGANRHRIELGQLGNRGQVVADFELSALDLAAQLRRDDLIRAERRCHGDDLLRHDAGHRVRGAPTGLVDPGGIDLEGRRAAATVAEPAGDGSYVDPRRDELGGRAVP